MTAAPPLLRCWVVTTRQSPLGVVAIDGLLPGCMAKGRPHGLTWWPDSPLPRVSLPTHKVPSEASKLSSKLSPSGRLARLMLLSGASAEKVSSMLFGPMCHSRLFGAANAISKLPVRVVAAWAFGATASSATVVPASAAAQPSRRAVPNREFHVLCLS